MKNLLIQNRCVKVFGKGGKERIVPIGTTVGSALQQHISFLRGGPIHPDMENVFLTLDGLPMTSRPIYLVLKRLGKKAGVQRLHPHLCRHTFAAGGDTRTVKGNEIAPDRAVLETVNMMI